MGEGDAAGQVPGEGWNDFEPGPLTAFGQWGPGRLDLRVFDQDTWWVNRDGLAFRIASEMSALYLANVIAFLEEHRDYYHLMTVRRAALTFLEDAQTGRPAGLPAALVAAVDTDDSSVWLEGTVLMRRLRARMSAH